jgi:hypothetical protein
MKVTASVHRRSTRRARAAATSRSRITSRTGFAVTGSLTTSRLVFRNSSGSAISRRRYAGEPSRHAA